MKEGHYSLDRFLGTPQGADWLAIAIDTWEQNVLSQADKFNTSLNSWLKQQYNELVNPRVIEKTLDRGIDKALETISSTALTPLTMPLSVTEQFLRRRVIGLVRRNLRRCILFFAWRVTLASLLVETAKAAVRRAVANTPPRVKGTVCFCLDAALPVAYCGPALGIYAGVMRLLQHPERFCSESESSSSESVGFGTEDWEKLDRSQVQLHFLQDAVALTASKITKAGRAQLQRCLTATAPSATSPRPRLGDFRTQPTPDEIQRNRWLALRLRLPLDPMRGPL